MKTTVFAFALLAATLLAASRSTVPVRQDGGREAVMKEKLAHAQKLLASLATNDLEAAAQDASAMAALTRDARWRVRETPEYLSRSVEFERATSTLASMAAGKNAEGAALAWVQVTTQCLDCHRWLRATPKPH